MTKKRIFLKEPSDYNPNKQEKREQDDLFYNDINEYSSILKKLRSCTINIQTILEQRPDFSLDIKSNQI